MSISYYKLKLKYSCFSCYFLFFIAVGHDQYQFLWFTKPDIALMNGQ